MTAMKQCCRCKQEKPEDQFYVKQGYCKACCYSQQKEWYERNRKRKADINREWRKRNAIRRKAMVYVGNAVYYATRHGKLERGTVCTFCAATQNIEAAHFDYSQPLNVIWLCRPCHRQWDAIRAKSV